MENVILVIHLILALFLIGIVLLQRSEGGGLGIGGGGGAMAGRAPLTALGKLTWLVAIAFIITSTALTLLAARNSAGSSVVDRLGIDAPAAAEAPDLTEGGSLLPPSTEEEPLAPARADE